MLSMIPAQNPWAHRTQTSRFACSMTTVRIVGPGPRLLTFL
jgi:hypothetical protein